MIPEPPVLLWLFPGMLILGMAFTWLLDARLYGHDLVAALRVTARAAGRSRGRSFLVASVLLILSTVVLLAMFDRRIAFVAASFGTVALSTQTWVLRPPGVLLLASSGSTKTRDLAHRLTLAAIGHRVMYFLRDAPIGRRDFPDRASQLNSSFSDPMDNRFVSNDEAWDDVVFPLIDIVPVIVIDARVSSPALTREVERINATPRLAAKTLLLEDPWSGIDLRRYTRLSTRVTRSTETLEQAIRGALNFRRQFGDDRGEHSAY